VAALNEVEAKRIGRAALRRVLSEHTYRHRAMQLEVLLGERIAA
jgi:spore maturation protein CgeB